MLSNAFIYFILVAGGTFITGLRFYFAIKDAKKSQEKTEKAFEEFLARKEKMYV